VTKSVIYLLTTLFISLSVLNASAQVTVRHRVNTADRVVVGKIVLVKEEPTDGLPISEHSPNWHNAVIEVEETLKGSPRVALLIVRFPNTMDVAFFDVPKFSVGQEGVFILHKDDIDESGLYIAFYPMDFQPKTEVQNIKSLLP